ncbi:MAG: hypothetical protein ACW99A_19195 [Candidatus Kariarchaeaceae archaeon]
MRNVPKTVHSCPTLFSTKKQERWSSVYELKMVCQWLNITEILSLWTPVGREAEGSTVFVKKQNPFQLIFLL